MNSFGRVLRINIFGESHGNAVGITIDGCKPGLPLSVDDFKEDLERRKGGKLSGTTSRSEEDLPKFLSGVFNGFTTGAPITIIIENNDTRSKDYESLRSTPRPGHADFVASKKFGGFEDYRGGGHFSGRLTACLVMAGVIAKKILQTYLPQIEIKSEVIEVGGNSNIQEGIALSIEKNDSVGAIVKCSVKNIPIGLGEPFFDSVESLISHAVFAIPAVKGIEFGLGFGASKMFGSLHNDPIINETGLTSSNNSGGITGGISNGNELDFRIVIKPASSTPQPQQSFNKDTGDVQPLLVKGRHDLVIALRVPPVLEAVTACVLLDLFMLDKSIFRK